MDFSFLTSLPLGNLLAVLAAPSTTSSTPPLGVLAGLPNEVLCRIIMHLPPKEVCNITASCQAFRNLVESNETFIAQGILARQYNFVAAMVTPVKVFTVGGKTVEAGAQDRAWFMRGGTRYCQCQQCTTRRVFIHRTCFRPLGPPFLEEPTKVRLPSVLLKPYLMIRRFLDLPDIPQYTISKWLRNPLAWCILLQVLVDVLRVKSLADWGEVDDGRIRAKYEQELRDLLRLGWDPSSQRDVGLWVDNKEHQARWEAMACSYWHRLFEPLNAPPCHEDLPRGDIVEDAEGHDVEASDDTEEVEGEAEADIDDILESLREMFEGDGDAEGDDMFEGLHDMFEGEETQ